MPRKMSGGYQPEHAESDGDKKQGLELELDTQKDECQAKEYHDDVAPCDVGETRVHEELYHLGRQKVHETT